MFTLAIETSCDETSAAVLNDSKVLSNIISSQFFHSEYGGVVPEVASREHLKKLPEITRKALNDAAVDLNNIDIIAATSEPGLIGALLTGLNFAKGISVSLNKPFVPVNHIHSHLYSNMLSEQKTEFPFIGLIVSGGHTLIVLAEGLFRHKILGSTIDDAAGEAFDKVAKLLGLGYPGGPKIDRNAANGDDSFHKFPKAKVKNEFDFSFSGIKTSVLYYLKKTEFEKNKNEKLINDISASFQKAVVDMLVDKTIKAAVKYNIKTISVSGGVSANKGLRERFLDHKKEGYEIFFPKPEYSTDNAAMIGLAAYLKYNSADNKEYFKADSLKQSARARIDHENF